jgi:Domain of unknown function (DUF397)
MIVLRDSKQPPSHIYHFAVSEWRAFLGGVKDGEFDVTDAGPRCTY